MEVSGGGGTGCAGAALRAGAGVLAAAGERAGGGAARAAHRLRRSVSLLLHARAHLAHDHQRCKYVSILTFIDRIFLLQALVLVSFTAVL